MPESSRLKFLGKFIGDNFRLSDAEDNTSGSLNRGGIADLALLRTIIAFHQKFRESSFWEVIDSFVLLAYANVAALRTLLQRLLACLNVTLYSEDLFCWYKWKMWFLLTTAAAQAAKNHGREYFPRGIYTSIPTWTHSQNSLAAEALNLKISSHWISLKWSRRPSQSARE